MYYDKNNYNEINNKNIIMLIIIRISNAIENQEVIPRWPLGSPIDINSFKITKEKKKEKEL